MKNTADFAGVLTGFAMRLRSAARAAQVAVCDYDIRVQMIAGDSRFGEMYGLAPREKTPLTYREWLNGIQPEDGRDSSCRF